MNTSNRLLYLDNLKVCLTVLVIFHHAGQAYGDGGGWAYHPSNPAEFMPWIWHFFSVNAAFFMGLFFLISGYFVPTSFDKQGAKVFVQKKLIRLGIPLLLMGGLIAALSGKPEIGHMWYIESLLVFCLIYALIRLICKPIDGECSSRPTIIGLLIFGGVMNEEHLTKAIASVTQLPEKGAIVGGTLWTMVMDLKHPSVTYYSRRHFDKPLHFTLSRTN